MATKTEVKRYSFPRTSGFSGMPEQDVQIVGQCVDETRERVGGEMVARTIAQDARDEGHPWHNMLPWDDRAAADTYRATIVSSTISMIRVTIVDADEDEVEVPAFFTTTIIDNEPENGEDAEWSRRTFNFASALEDTERRDMAITSVVKIVAAHLPRVEACGSDLEFLRRAIRKAQRLYGLV